MPITDKIYAAADREGIGLAEYIRRTYSSESLEDLQNNLRTQLSSLQGEIAGFIGGVEIPKIEANLMTASSEKLDLMQSRIRRNLSSRVTELENMLSNSVSGTFADSGFGITETALQPEDLLASD